MTQNAAAKRDLQKKDRAQRAFSEQGFKHFRRCLETWLKTGICSKYFFRLLAKCQQAMDILLLIAIQKLAHCRHQVRDSEQRRLCGICFCNSNFPESIPQDKLGIHTSAVPIGKVTLAESQRRGKQHEVRPPLRHDNGEV